MHSGPLVGRYTRALFEVAAEQNVLENVRADLGLLREVMAQRPELLDVLVAPVMGMAQKRRLLEEAFGEYLNEITRRFLMLLLTKRRIAILSEVIRTFEVFWRERHREVLVTVTTAVEPDDRQQEEIITKLKARTEKRPIITWQVEPSLIGGMQVRWPDHIEDGSLRRKLFDMRAHLAAC